MKTREVILVISTLGFYSEQEAQDVIELVKEKFDAEDLEGVMIQIPPKETQDEESFFRAILYALRQLRNQKDQEVYIAKLLMDDNLGDQLFDGDLDDYESFCERVIDSFTQYQILRKSISLN